MYRTRIKIEIKDNYDNNYNKVIYLYIDDDDCKILKNYESEDYDRVWNNLCDRISEFHTDLPYDWYIDRLEL